MAAGADRLGQSACSACARGARPQVLVTTTPRPVPALRALLAMRQCAARPAGRAVTTRTCAPASSRWSRGLWRHPARPAGAARRADRRRRGRAVAAHADRGVAARTGGLPRGFAAGRDRRRSADHRGGRRMRHRCSAASASADGALALCARRPQRRRPFARAMGEEGRRGGGEMARGPDRRRGQSGRRDGRDGASRRRPQASGDAGPRAARQGARAEPIAAFFETGEAKLAGRFPALEDQLAGMTTGGSYEGPGRSPDRADACIWALTELLLGPPPSIPRIIQL